MSDQFETLIDKLEAVRHHGADQVSAKCPAHPDAKASLSVARGVGGRVVLTCHAGCQFRDILTAIGVPLSDVFGEPRVVAEYVYTDADSRPLYVVERWEPKSFRQRMIDGRRKAPQPHERVLYNLPVIAALRSAEVKSLFFVEGEKDADTLAAKGYAATTSLGGANKPWLPQYTEALTGLHVVVVADNDQPGRKWARTVAEALEGSAEVSVVVPPSGIKDVTELLEAGFAVTDLVPLANTIGEIATAADYPIRQVEWLWPGRIPAHMLTLLEGDPGTGKSTMTMELIACLTTGAPLPGQHMHQEPVTVGLLSDEDNWSMVVVPRLQAAGADLHRVVHFRGIRDQDGFLIPYSLPDLNTLRHDLRKTDVAVLIIDPLMAYLGSELDTHRDSSVRSVLGPLVQMAEEDGVTILAVRHFTKGSLGGKAIYRGGGSIGFTGQARAVLQTGEFPRRGDEDDEQDKGRYVLAVAKCNLAPLAPTLAYRITTDERMDVSRVAWEELPVAITAAELSSSGLPSDKQRAESLGPGKDAKDWLSNLMADGKVRSWKDIVGLAMGTHADITLRRVRNEVCIQVLGSKGNSTSMWRGINVLPEAPQSPLAHPDRSQIDEQVGSSGTDEQVGTEQQEHTTTQHTQSPLAQEAEHLLPLAHASGSAVDEQEGPCCSVCRSTEGLILNEVGEARCRHHHWLIFTTSGDGKA